ncbi:MAG TPA: DUF2911 domain-containing protein [Chitinophagaceae bacterium]|nr:DUF2911 domain-containing protein [Chitinophagaceae bacterium]
MKYTFLALIFGCALFSASAQTLKTPAPSPTQTVKQDFGLSSIELSYSRPGIKGRKIFGDVVPFGKVWRTGANSATTLTFGDDVTIGGTKIPAGKYGLLTIPDADNWVLIITKQLNVTSPAAYKPESDVVRVTAKTIDLPFAIESFTIQFGNVQPTACELQLMWDKTVVLLPITTEIDTKVMAQIKNQVESDPRPYFNAAMYYMDNGKDLNKALYWFDQSLVQNPGAFFILYQKAVCLSKLGRRQEAIDTANQGITAATAAKNDDYVALNKKLLATLK